MPTTRRQFLAATAAAPLLTAPLAARSTRAVVPATKTPQRVCVVLFDGFGTPYYEQSAMPTLKTWAKDGFFKRVEAAMPTVTNTQSAGLCCGVDADQHGITANSYWDADTDTEQFMSDPNLLTAATVFQRAARQGVRSALISAKQKTISLLQQGTSFAAGSQKPPAELVRLYGPPPDIYTAEVNYWVWQMAVDLIKNSRKTGLFFVHTTDYPMHMHPPEAGESRTHLAKVDEFLAAAADADPEMAFIIAPDHGLNSKSVVVNLNLALPARGAPVRFAMSAERDQYPRHHGGYGGTAFIYLNAPGDVDRTVKALQQVDGVEEVLHRDEAAAKYKLNPFRIGDLWATAKPGVVFGPGPGKTEREELPKAYRSHGSAHERDVPGVVYRWAGKLPDKGEVRSNIDLGRFLYRG